MCCAKFVRFKPPYGSWGLAIGLPLLWVAWIPAMPAMASTPDGGIVTQSAQEGPQQATFPDS